MPNTIKHYVHRVGRTARAGRTGRAVSLVGEQERKILKEVIKAARQPVKQRIIAQGISSPGSLWVFGNGCASCFRSRPSVQEED